MSTVLEKATHHFNRYLYFYSVYYVRSVDSHFVFEGRISVLHYANTTMQYTAIFHGCKNVNFQMKDYSIFLFFCSKTLIVGTHSNRLIEAVLMSTHNLCFRAKIREKNNVYPCTPQFYYIKVGCKGVFITRTRFHDGFTRS